MLASQVQVRINGRLIQPLDMRVTSLVSAKAMQERVWWAAYMYRVFGAWPGEGEENPTPNSLHCGEGNEYAADG